MKLLILLILPFFCFSQETVSLSVHQDLRFATVGDQKRGYKPGTINVLLRLKMQGKQDRSGFASVFPEFEYGDIEGIYKRYSLNAGYTFNTWIKNVEPSIYIGYGWIDRFGKSLFSGSLNAELSYKISKKLKLSANGQFTDRRDLKWLYGKGKIGFSGFVGIEFNLFKK